ncbi:MAG: metallophosphoesterase [Thermoproteota archaeon]|uniref:Metallophosphoesterase n=1 Tax=Candidatus Methanodesulfokora washburnensis TaxID=2478471 RepID=A0A520KI78_9CREN|nr:MAG: metallophosphoesterase [Candidatus Methanodesulfokores washburnensis]TDA41224.1 MAG: metallophosphoesterase [Candidatus Korarchaeota archaeon]
MKIFYCYNYLFCMRLTRRKFIASALIGICAAITANDSSFPEVKEVKVDLGFNMTMMVISDLHLHGWGWREDILHDLLVNTAKKADIALILGDSYDNSTPDPRLVKKMLQDIEIPKVGVLGNHEHWASNKIPLSEGVRVYEEAGVKLLTNESAYFRGVRFGGVDWYEDEVGMGRAYLEDVGEVDVLLSHTPDIIGLSPKARLVVSGHTHGGQICIPLLGPIWTPSKYGNRFASGLFNVNGTYLYVNKGLGETILPIRFNCRRELTLIYI